MVDLTVTAQRKAFRQNGLSRDVFQDGVHFGVGVGRVGLKSLGLGKGNRAFVSRVEVKTQFVYILGLLEPRFYVRKKGVSQTLASQQRMNDSIPSATRRSSVSVGSRSTA